MTWHTNSGDRTLEGAEAEFYLTAMQHAVEYLKSLEEVADELDVEPGGSFAPRSDRMFDIASFDQKVVLLHTWLSAFLDPNVETPELNNILEAAAYFPFAVLSTEIAIEIENEQTGEFAENETYRYFNRQFAWKAFEEYVHPSWTTAIEEYGEEKQAFR